MNKKIPDVLVNPPWEKKKTAAKKPSAPAAPIEVAQLPYKASLEWEEGERERFATTEWDPTALEPGGYLETLQKGNWAPPGPFEKWTEKQWRTLTTDWESRFCTVHGPEKLALEHIEEMARGKYPYEFHTAIVRFGLRILPLIALHVKEHGKERLDLLAPYDDAALAPIVASYLRIKKRREEAEAWLRRHPRAAAVGLIPDAVGKKGDAKTAALAALQLVDGAIVQEVLKEYGPDVERALGSGLVDDPRLAKSPPKAPAFWKPKKMTPIELRSGTALPPPAVENLRIYLTLSELERPVEGLREALAACDPSSLSRFGWELFEAWEKAGAPNAEKWAFSALGFLGDDDVVRKLTPLVRKWPGESNHARAALGLEILGAIGTELALMSIHGIAERLRFPALKELATKHVAAIAKKLGLSVAELEDRLVPALGLDARGTLVLDAGKEKLEVGFDELLVPFVRDKDGARVKSVPKKVQETFSALKKDARALASIQLARLERAMVQQRRWKVADFEKYVVGHPLLVHVARRLVFGMFEGKGKPVTFRVTEDRTYASVKDEKIALSKKSSIGIVHPLEIDAKLLSAWATIFADYEILQPFAQLSRARHTADEAARVLKSVVKTKHATGTVLKLTQQGWARGTPQDSGYVGCLTRPTSAGVLELELKEGFIAGAVGESPQQTIAGFSWNDKPADLAFLQRLAPIEASEVAYSLATLGG